jgi:hypothetical protein
MDFRDLEEKLLSYERRGQGAGASEEEVRNAEDQLSVSIAGGFRRFLTRFGWVRVNAVEIFGLGRDVPRHLDLIRLALSERTEMEPQIPPELLPVYNDGGGNLYCLDTSRRKEGEDPIVFWDHELGRDQTPDFVSETFVDWLCEKLSRK